MEKKYQDLALDLNLDQATSEDAWKCYSKMISSYTLEGDQMQWIACALYTASRKRSVPTVGGRPGNVIQGNCVSLTRMLQHCNLPLIEFISKMKLWLAMSYYEEDFCRKIDMLERNFAVSNNIFKKYKPMFLALFQNPANDSPRPPRSRKMRRPPCNATELFYFCWTLYVLIKGKYPCIPQDLVSCYCLLLAAVDLMYANVIFSNRRDLLNVDCEVLPPEESDIGDSPGLNSFSIMDYLCKNFDGVLVDTKVVREYYWMPNVKDLISMELLKGTSECMGLIDQVNFDKNVKDVKNAYEEHLLNCGEFDERMFLNEDAMVKAPAKGLSPKLFQTSSLGTPTPIMSAKAAMVNLVYDGDHHLVQQTPITGKRYTINRPVAGNTPITIVTSGLQKLYALISGRTGGPSSDLVTTLSILKNDPLDRVQKMVNTLSEAFVMHYSEATDDYTCPDKEFVKMRLQMIQILFYTFLEHILNDEKRKGVELEAILQEDMFHKTLFTLSIEIVLKSYNDARKFPWSLQVAKVAPYYFVRIIEVVIRSEKQNENQLPREIVKHFKSIEEQILDTFAWRVNSPLWEALKNDPKGVPSQFEVQLPLAFDDSVNNSNSSVLVTKTNLDVSLSPVSSIADTFLSPGSQARRMLFPPSKPVPRPQSDELRPLTASNSDRFTLLKTLSTVQQKVTCNGAGVTGENKPPQDKRGKVKRHGSLALFFRKFYTLAFLRLNDLMDRLDVTETCLRQTVWTVFEHSVINHVIMLEDRHMDQLVMCAIYITCKVTNQNKIFQEIMRHYRSQPQAASHIYRSVLISKSGSADLDREQKRNGPPPKPTEVTGSFMKLPSGVRGDLIKFYNFVYVQNMKGFTLKFCPTKEISKPVLSPLPQLKCTLASPRSRVSRNHSVFISSQALSQSRSSPQSATTKRPLYFFNRSPAKDLEVINSMVKVQSITAKRQLGDFRNLESSKAQRLEPQGQLQTATRRIQFPGNDDAECVSDPSIVQYVVCKEPYEGNQ